MINFLRKKYKTKKGMTYQFCRFCVWLAKKDESFKKNIEDRKKRLPH